MKRLPLVIKVFLLFVMLVVLLNLVIVTFSKPNETEEQSDMLTGSNLFKTNCSGCHLNGQNLIKSNKPVIGSPVLKSKKIFKEFLESPPQPMPNFKNIASKSSQLDSLYNYVNSLMTK